MTKILFVFGGTGTTAKVISENDNLQGFEKDVVRVYFNGCQDKSIGGSYIFGQLSPDLDIVGSKVRSCFDNKGQLSITALKEKFGNSIIIEPKDIEAFLSVDTINLTGFSRGAVTTFSVARNLDDLGKPIQIFAQDPVPGESMDTSQKKGAQFSKNYNLSACQNIKKAEVVIGGYRGSVNRFHDVFLRQMAPRFNPECNSHTYTLPKKNHISSAGASLNQEIRFLQATGFTTGLGLLGFSEKKDSMFFTPKVLAQAHHAQELMNLELLPIYREKICANIANTYKDPEKFNDQTLQALFALQRLNSDSIVKSSVENSILNDPTSRGNAIRDFVIEFENVNQHTLRRSPTEKKANPGVDSPDIDSPVINKFRESVYEQLIDLPLSSTTQDKEKFIQTVNEKIKGLKSQIPEQKYIELKKVTELFLSKHYLLTADFGLPIQANNKVATASQLETERTKALRESQKDLKRTLHAMAHPIKPHVVEPPDESPTI